MVKRPSFFGITLSFWTDCFLYAINLAYRNQFTIMQDNHFQVVGGTNNPHPNWTAKKYPYELRKDGMTIIIRLKGKKRVRVSLKKK